MTQTLGIRHEERLNECVSDISDNAIARHKPMQEVFGWWLGYIKSHILQLVMYANWSNYHRHRLVMLSEFYVFWQEYVACDEGPVIKVVLSLCKPTLKK